MVYKFFNDKAFGRSIENEKYFKQKIISSVTQTNY